MEKNLNSLTINGSLSSKALFIDRDGTINVDCPYCHKPTDLKIYDDSITMMREYDARGFDIVIVTNQSGIGRGYFTEDEMDGFNSALKEKLTMHGIHIKAIYYCPHLPEAGCNCRKPGTGLVERAARELDLDLKQSIIIGDRDDIEGEMARKLGMNYVIINRSKLPIGGNKS